MRIAYFDCFSGASGDMILGALLDAGLTIEQLRMEISRLHLSDYEIMVEKVVKKGIGASHAIVKINEHSHHRHLHDIEEIIENSDLASTVKEKSITIFRRLAEAEAMIHCVPVEAIHFHEVGAMDAIIDVVGAVAGMAVLRIDKVFCSSIHVGTGTITCAHGTLPVPAPATLELIKGKPIYSKGIEGELLTPTGAAILSTLSCGFGQMPLMTVESIGYGAGTRELPIPNLLRVVIGETDNEIKGYQDEQVAVIETNIDDMNPQIYDYLILKTLDAGALDIVLSPLQMKKNRPGMMVTVICQPNQVRKFADILIRETTTIGLRWRIDNRIKSQRSIKEVHTKYGTIRCKIAYAGDEIVNVSPEYEDCKRIALEKNVTLKEVMDAARLGV